MRLTSYTDYCLRVLIYVASQREGRATIAEIARSYDISENHLVKVVHFLGKAGFLTNVRGHGGGLQLARPAAKINVGAVVRNAEGPAIPAACFDPLAPRCALASVCRLRKVLGEAVRAFDDVLDRYTLADLVGGGERLHGLRAILFVPPVRRGKRVAAKARNINQ